MSNHNNDDFMNYVGYQLYGGGTDPNFQPIQTSNAPQINFNPKTVAFVILMFGISWFAESVGDSALYSNFFASFFISLLAGLAFFLYVPWSMKNELVELHSSRIISAILIYVYIATSLILNRSIFSAPINYIARYLYPFIYCFFIALCLLRKKPKQLTIWLALLAGSRILMGALSFFTYSAHANALQYIQFVAMIIAWIVLFAVCTHPGWKKGGIITSIIVAIWTIPGLISSSVLSIVLQLLNAAWMIMLAFTMANSRIMVETKNQS